MQYDITFLYRYIAQFPTSPNTSIITGYLRFFSLPLPDEEGGGGSAAATRGKKENRRERRKAKAEERARNHPAEEAMPEGEASEDEDIHDDVLLERAGAPIAGGKKAIDDHKKDPFAVIMVCGYDYKERRVALSRDGRQIRLALTQIQSRSLGIESLQQRTPRSKIGKT